MSPPKRGRGKSSKSKKRCSGKHKRKATGHPVGEVLDALTYMNPFRSIGRLVDKIKNRKK